MHHGKNNSGGAYAPSQNNRWDIDSGALYNGMVEPWINFTIKGALWYQVCVVSLLKGGVRRRLGEGLYLGK